MVAIVARPLAQRDGHVASTIAFLGDPPHIPYLTYGRFVIAICSASHIKKPSVKDKLYWRWALVSYEWALQTAGLQQIQWIGLAYRHRWYSCHFFAIIVTVKCGARSCVAEP
jgi:hypothetical protein